MSGKKGFTCKDLFPWMSNQTSTNISTLVCKLLSTGVQAPHAMCQFPSWTKGPFILYIQLDGTCPPLNSAYKYGNVQWEKSSHLNALEKTSIFTCFNTPLCKSKRTWRILRASLLLFKFPYSHLISLKQVVLMMFLSMID